MKEVIQAALSVVVPGQEEQMWSCLREERELVDTDEELATKRKQIDSGLLQTLISAHNDAENWQTKSQIFSLFVNDRQNRAYISNTPRSSEDGSFYCLRIKTLLLTRCCVQHPKTETRQWWSCSNKNVNTLKDYSTVPSLL